MGRASCSAHRLVMGIEFAGFPSVAAASKAYWQTLDFFATITQERQYWTDAPVAPDSQRDESLFVIHREGLTPLGQGRADHRPVDRQRRGRGRNRRARRLIDRWMRPDLNGWPQHFVFHCSCLLSVEVKRQAYGHDGTNSLPPCLVYRALSLFCKLVHLENLGRFQGKSQGCAREMDTTAHLPRHSCWESGTDMI
jgi:hypothetical protein